MTKTWEEIRDEVAGMLADGKPLEDVIPKLEQMKNEMAKAELIAVFDELKKPKPLTNEEWFFSLSTEEKAKTIICLAVNSMHKKRKGLIDSDVGEIMRWLKEKHE